MKYGDTIRIVKTTKNNYGSEVYADEATVAAIFQQSTGWRHTANQAAISSDAIAFVDPEDEFVQDNFNRLEGMLVVAQFSGVGIGEAWYRITDVLVARDSQLSNQVDNVQLSLKKTSPISGVS